MTEKLVGFMTACKQFFGQKPGQTLLDFRNEVGKLTPQDRGDMIPGLEKELGVKIDTKSAQ